MSDIQSGAPHGKRPGVDPQGYQAKRDGTERPPGKLTIRVRLDGDPPRDLSFEGRDAWALIQLLNAGEAECTPLDVPGPRWSHYIFKLRRGGLVIETITEPHGGAFAGHHARYLLRSRVQVLELNDPRRSHSSEVRP